MQFNLNYNPPISDNKISHTDEVLFIGSCFSENISERLIGLKFPITSNPFGIVFNPKSIEVSLNRVLEKKYFNEFDVFEKEGIWFSLEVHSSITKSTKKELVDSLNQTIDLWHDKIKASKYLFITLGSAFAYRNKSSDNIIANCHKLPTNQFDKELLEISVIAADYQNLIHKLQQLNSQLQIVFTVSPVKHLRDGVVENNLSKAVLIQLVHQLVNQNSGCTYFPAYELVNDDLRDYRFYDSDMAHPNKQAVEYVWEKFSNSFFSDETKKINEKILDIIQAFNHKPFNNNTESHLKFLRAFKDRSMELKAQFPYLNLESEINYFSNNI